MRGRPDRAIYVPPSQRRRDAAESQNGATGESSAKGEDQNTDKLLAKLSPGPSGGSGSSTPGRIVHAWETVVEPSPASSASPTNPKFVKESPPRRRNRSSSSSRKPQQKSATSPARREGTHNASPSRESPSSTLKVTLRRSLPTTDHTPPIPVNVQTTKPEKLASPKPPKSKGKSGPSYKDSVVTDIKKSQKDPDPPIRFVPAKALITDASWADEEEFDYTQVPKWS